MIVVTPHVLGLMRTTKVVMLSTTFKHCQVIRRLLSKYLFVAYRREKGKPVGRGPCADLFKGEECAFYPDYPLKGKAFPACCDANGCSCECIYTCTTRHQIMELLQKKLNQTHFEKCTSSISSLDQVLDWKLEQCKKSNGSFAHRQAIKRCGKKGSDVSCARSGTCIKNRRGKDECRFCFR